MKTKIRLVLGLITLMCAVFCFVFTTCYDLNKSESSVDTQPNSLVYGKEIKMREPLMKHRTPGGKVIKLVQDVKPVSEKETVMESNCSNVVTTAATTNKENVANTSSQRRITMRALTVKNPSSFDFGKYQWCANDLYQKITSNPDSYYLEYFFDSHEESVNFSTKINNSMIPAGVCLYELHYSGTERNPETNEWTKKYSVIYDSERTKTKIDLRKALDAPYNACVSAGIQNGTTERDALDKIVNWIRNNMTYVLNNGDAYVGFTTGQGQCHTYAQMLQAMCNVCGIECRYISGQAGGDAHAWNQVKIDNKWYYVDATWYDSTGNDTYKLSEHLWNSHKKN